jgi:hypothetical protein
MLVSGTCALDTNRDAHLVVGPRVLVVDPSAPLLVSVEQVT